MNRAKSLFGNLMGILFFLCFTASLTATAAVTVRSVKAEKKRLILEQPASGEMEEGQLFTADTEDGTCDFKVLKVQGKLGVADSKGCAVMDKITTGQEVSPKASSGSSKSARHGTRHRVGGLLGYSLAGEMESSVKVGTSTTVLTDTMGGAVGLGLRYQMDLESGIGFNAGFNYELERKITSHSAKAGGVTTTTTLNDAKYSVSYLEGNGLYRFGNFFGFGGINYSMPTLSGADLVGYKLASGLGIQGGAGYEFTDMFGFEVGYRTINHEETYSNALTGELTFDYSRVWGIFLRGYALMSL